MREFEENRLRPIPPQPPPGVVLEEDLWLQANSTSSRTPMSSSSAPTSPSSDSSQSRENFDEDMDWESDEDAAEGDSGTVSSSTHSFTFSSISDI